MQCHAGITINLPEQESISLTVNFVQALSEKLP